jgi:hypothetical protein
MGTALLGYSDNDERKPISQPADDLETPSRYLTQAEKHHTSTSSAMLREVECRVTGNTSVQRRAAAGFMKSGMMGNLDRQRTVGRGTQV